MCYFQKLPTVPTALLTAYPPAEFSRLKEWCVLRDNSLRCRIDFCTASSRFIDVVPWEQGQNHGNILYFEQWEILSLPFRLFCDAVPACERSMQFSLEIITNRAVSPDRITSRLLSVPRRSYRPGVEFVCEVVLQPEQASASLSVRLSVLPSVSVSVRMEQRDAFSWNLIFMISFFKIFCENCSCVKMWQK